MFVISTGYVILHRSVRPPAQTHVYDMFFDASMFQTLLTYCRWAVGTHYIAQAAVLTALIVFLIIRVRQNDWLPLLFLGWFAITVAPYLPLRNHISDYYLMVPTIGLAMLGGYALVCAQVEHAQSCTCHRSSAGVRDTVCNRGLPDN